MDLVQRLIALLLLAVLSPVAMAYGSVGPTAVQVSVCADTFTGRTPADACGAWIAAQPTTEGKARITRQLVGCSATVCTVHIEKWAWDDYFQRDYMFASTDALLNVTGGSSQGCPAYSSKVGSKCECNTGFKSESGQCVPYSCPGAGNYTAITQPDQAVPNAGDGICQGGCGYTPSSWKAGQDGTIWAAWPFKSTGKACGGSAGTDGVKTGEQNTNNPAPIPCGANQCPGSASMNGVTTQMCVACKGTSAAPTTEAASAPAGSASGASTGDQTKTTQTECDGTTCTTTTVTRDGGGNVTGSTSKQEPQENFCQSNPSSPMCKKSSFGGSCAATACDGDAVQCALAQEVIKRNCQWYDDANQSKPQQDVGNAAMAAGNKPDWHPGAAGNVQEVNFASGSQWDQTDRLGGGGCAVSDEVVAVGTVSVTLPFSRACSVFAWLGPLFVAMSMVAAAFITFKS